jgi:hypothetical protein
MIDISFFIKKKIPFLMRKGKDFSLVAGHLDLYS